jgi:hypothetical protein
MAAWPCYVLEAAAARPLFGGITAMSSASSRPNLVRGAERKLHPGQKARWCFELVLVDAWLERASCSNSRVKGRGFSRWLCRFGLVEHESERVPE